MFDSTLNPLWQRYPRLFRRKTGAGVYWELISLALAAGCCG